MFREKQLLKKTEKNKYMLSYKILYTNFLELMNLHRVNPEELILRKLYVQFISR